MYVEMYYFHKWWHDSRTTVDEKVNLRTLIKRGQWEFVEGGWVMPDEANPTYSALADQLTEGHIFLNETFGITPQIGYQIDPFGASTAVAQTYQRAGFKYHILDRIDYNLKNTLTAKKELEFHWTPIPGSSESIFTHILDNNYCMPMIETFNFESSPLLNPPINSWDLVARSIEYALLIRQRASWYRSKHVLVLHQCDFAYQNASSQFDNMDKIINYLSQNQATFNMTIRWSTLGEYFHSLNDLPASFWPTKTNQDDYFPYADINYSWWTGYYTSRPELKGLVREAEAALRLSDVLGLPMIAAKLVPSAFVPSELHKAHAVAQHHDAVAGTEKAYVVEHYAQLLQDGRDSAQKINLRLLALTSGASLNVWTNTTEALKNLQPGSSVAVLVFNSLFTDRTDVLQLPIWSWRDISVTDGSGVPIKDYTALENLDPRDLAISPASLFVNVHAPPAGWTIIKVLRNSQDVNSDPQVTNGPIENEFVRISIDSNTGLLNGLTTHLNAQPKSYDISQNILSYQSYPGPGQPSGAYIFRPVGDAQPITNRSIHFIIRSTPFVKEIYQQFGGASQTIRLYSHHSWVHLSNWIGTIEGNTEVVSRWKIPFSGPAFHFHYDNNGLVTQSAARVQQDLIIPGNYKPSVYHAAQGQFGAVFSTDRSHGVSSAEQGTFEMMLHRRLLQDDWRGLDEAMNDTSIINPKMRITFCEGCSTTKMLSSSYNATYGLNFPLQPFFYAPSAEYTGPTQYAPFKQNPLPSGLHVSQFRLIADGRALVTINALWTESRSVVFDVLHLAPKLFCSASRTSLTGMHVLERNSQAAYRSGDMHTFVVHFC